MSLDKATRQRSELLDHLSDSLVLYLTSGDEINKISANPDNFITKIFLVI